MESKTFSTRIIEGNRYEQKYIEVKKFHHIFNHLFSDKTISLTGKRAQKIKKLVHILYLVRDKKLHN